ncbi:MAG: peptide chain release factor-like protein [Candidatus Paceibacterota bacterium]
MSFNPNIIYISTFPGAGGDDAKDWAIMLLEMYGKYAKKKGWKARVVDSDTIEVRGKDAYGRLKAESGVHRLVRISPYDSKGNRHTSFALVEVLPELADFKKTSFTIPEKDLKYDFSRASGPGGQNVNKVETSVRIVHIPTGVSASSQAERSQVRNREKALDLLKSKLLKLLEEKREEDLENLRVNVTPDWGHELRSYVLHPYKSVRDKRLGTKISQVEEVLDGDLDLIYNSK